MHFKSRNENRYYEIRGTMSSFQYCMHHLFDRAINYDEDLTKELNGNAHI